MHPFSHILSLIIDLYKGRNLSISLNKDKVGLKIHPGMHEGNRIRATLAGRPLIFVIQEKPHPLYRRSGADLLIEMELEIHEVSLTYYRVPFPSLPLTLISSIRPYLVSIVSSNFLMVP